MVKSPIAEVFYGLTRWFRSRNARPDGCLPVIRGVSISSSENTGLSCCKCFRDADCAENSSYMLHRKGIIIGNTFGVSPIPRSNETRETQAPTLQQAKQLRCFVSFCKFYAV